MIGLAALLSNTAMSFFREHLLISIPEVAERVAGSIVGWDLIPQPLTSVCAVIAKHKATIWHVLRHKAAHNQDLAVLTKTNDQTSSNSRISPLSAGNKLSFTVGCSLAFFEHGFQRVA